MADQKASNNPGKKPNILLITTDQHHFSALGAVNSKIKTPNLDRLCKEGTLFTRAYCPNPTCTPTRASIITGMYPSQHGAWSLGTKLLEDVPTLGDEMQRHGYRTALIGKAHFEPLKSTEEFSSQESYPILNDLQYWKHFHGPYFGFEHIELARNHTDEGHVGQHYANWMEEKGFLDWKEYFQKPGGKKKLRWTTHNHTWLIPEEFHYNTWIGERTNKKLEQFVTNNDNFFLWASFLDPHYPQLAPEPWTNMYDPEEIEVPEVTSGEHRDSPPQTRWAQCKLEPGQPFRNILRKFKASRNAIKFGKEYYPDFKAHGQKPFGLHGFQPHIYNREKLKKQIAVYYGMVSFTDKYVGKILDKLDELGITDNTIVVFTTDHGDFFGQHGLLHKAGFEYEDLIKLPFIVRYPGKVPQSTRNATLQSLIDLAPTFLSLCDLPCPKHMTGMDQSPAWQNPKTPVRSSILCEHHHSPTSVHMKTYVDDRYKMTVYFNRTYGEIYDLEKDSGEIRNLWDDPDSLGLKTELLEKLVRIQIG